MTPDIIKLVSLILGISVAGDRLVTIIKSAVPELAAPPASVPGTQPVPTTEDRIKKVALMIIAFLCCSFTAFLINNLKWDPIKIGSLQPVSIWLLGLLASAGSAFWTNILGYLTSLKDLNNQKALQTKLHMQAQLAGCTGTEPALDDIAKARAKRRHAAGMGTVRFAVAFSGGPGNMLIQIKGVRDLNFSDDGFQDVDLPEGNYLYAVSGGASNGPGGGAKLTISGAITDSPQDFGPGVIVEKTHPLRVTLT